MEIVIQIAGKIVDYTFAPVGQWLCYSFHYNSNKENLKNQEEPLRNAKDRVQHLVDTAKRNGELIEGDVETWLRNATTKLNEIEAKAGNRSSNAACLNLKHRHQLSREAKKMVENIDQLLDEYHKNGNFEKVSHRPPPKGMETTRTMDYMAMDSRMTAVKDIMEALGNADIDKIGVWGMPGVGKSTLMKEIARQAMEEKLFNEVVTAAVTASPDVRRIQERIAFTLGLNFDQQTDEEGRASQLKQRISSKDKKILVILDDIWKELDLQEIGIPSEGCKVVMTSRDRNVLVSKMDAQKDIELKILQEAEAFNLIEKIAGDSFKDQPEVRGVATEIAKKCEGLPIALVTVSKALKNKSLSEWRDILRQLKRPAPEHITEMTLKTIYSPIEVSYNNLESPELKSLFLLCALLPYFLSYRDLLKYSYGWGLFHGIYTLEEARDRLDRRLRELKDSCLLLERSDGFCMHDLVRDVATIIASKDNNMFVMRDEGGLKEWPDVDALKRCQAFSTFDQPPNEMECPELIFFLLISSKSSLQIPSTLFQGMEKLKVLDLTEMRLPSLPSSLLVLRNLQTLCLDRCMLEDISGIGELKNLVVLSLLHSEISKLPREIGSLVRLQMLDLRNCFKLEMIPPNVISRLVNLDELYMGNSVVQWEVEGLNDERKNASLTELKHLSNLNTLEIQIPDVSKLPKDFNFEKLERYKICIGDVWHWLDSVQSSRTLKLKLNSSIQSEFWNKMPLKRLEILHLEGQLNGVMSVIPEIDREAFQQTKYLCIENGVELKYIVNLSTSITVFPTLETFILSNMIKLEEICQGELPSTCFKKLRVLKLENCEKLRFVFSSSIARGLSLLEELEIKRCNNMGAIVVKEEKDGIEDGDVILFPRLQTLVLKDLPELASFLSTRNSFTTDGREIIAEGNHELHMALLHHQVAFPNLTNLYLRGIPKIKHVWSRDPQTILRFQNLQKITARKCARLKNLFPASIGTCLKQLKEIEIDDCGVLEEIVGDEGGEAMGSTLVFEFPQLTSLDLANLPRLECFHRGVHISKWPMLETMSIQECEKVEVFASGLVSFEETIEERQYSMSIKQTLFLVDEMSFPSLELLEISKLEKLEIIWYGVVTASLTTLDITISDCGSLEAVFEQHEGQNGKEFHALTATQRLRALYLSSLPKLRNIWNIKDCHQRHMYSFPNLLLIDVKKCNCLKSLFPASIGTCLKQLKEIRIEACGVLEEIVGAEGGEAMGRTLVFEFPQLTSLDLAKLPRLECFYKGVYISKWPMLETMSIEKCKKVEVFASGLMSFEETVEERQYSQMSIKQPLFLVDEMPFPSLEILKISKMKKLEIIWNIKDSHQRHMYSFPNLLHIDVKKCDSLKSLFHIIRIEACGVLEEIVGAEGGEAMGRTLVFEFPQLTSLDFVNLPRLECVYKGVYISKWPMLKTMSIEKCKKVEVFASGLMSFEETVEERQYSQMSIKQPIFLVDELSFLSLKKLIIARLDKLEIIWQDQVAVSSFSHIQDVQIHGCEKLLHVFQSNFRTTTILTQRLTRLCIWDCRSLETIFRNMEGHNGKEPQVLIALSSGTEESVAREDGTARHIEFPILTQMRLARLPKLKWILEGVHANLECPSLEILELWECEQVIWASKFASSSSSQEKSQQNKLQTCIQLPLPNLLELELGICRVKLPSTSFKKLRVLKLNNCEKLRFVFSSSIARGLSLLEKLEIKRCNNMGAIVVKEEKDRIEDGDVVLFHQLQTLVLEDLPELVSFLSTRSSFMTNSGQIITEGNRDLHMSLLHHQVAFPNLTKLHLRNLPKIKHVWSKDPQTILKFQNLQEIFVEGCASLKSLFTVSVGTCLKKLKEIRINDCGVLEEIVGGEGGEAVGRTLVFVFPQVTHLSLSNLPRLEYFYKGVHISKWPMLKEMQIHKCEKVEIFASGLVSEETSEEKQSHMSIKQPLFLVDEMPFPSLEILRIHEMEKLEIIWNIEDSHQRHMYSFPNLLHIDVSLCESLKSLFPAALVAASLPQLQSIMITCCVVMEEIFEREDGTYPTTRLLFPSLICLGLYGLPKLKWFFQGLRTLESSSSKELHEQGGTLFMVEEVAFPNLKLLDLYGLPKINHVWSKDSQTIPSFQNLRVIIAGKCVSLESLFPASIIRCLEQLKIIKIYECGVEEIVAAEGGGEVEMTVVFPQVTSLCLENLRRLKGVDENVKLSFPSLVTLKIRRMYKLEIMSRNVTIRKLWRSCYARCLHAKESYRLREALMPDGWYYEWQKMSDVSYGFLR